MQTFSQSSKAQTAPSKKQSATTATAKPGMAAAHYDFSRMPIRAVAAGTIQKKLPINTPGDRHEQEADRVAEQLMRMPQPQLQRSCACGGHCEECRKKSTERDGSFLQRKTGAGSALGQTEAPRIVHDVLRSSGQPLHAATRAQMEPRFGQDFSNVQIHTGAQAAESARAVDALAYTVRNHIVFGEGQYAPETSAGSRLLAHELTHTVQQGSTDAPTVARFSDTVHHEIDEVALAGAGFCPGQIQAIEQGNIHRDYSQVYTEMGGGVFGRIGTFITLCKPADFGGYRQQEHFDNYIWDDVQDGWRTRGGNGFAEAGVDMGPTPIDYIASELEKLVNSGVTYRGRVESIGLTDAGMEHLGNAFHTVEDFFAHSNFVELLQGEHIYGDTLVTAYPYAPRNLTGGRALQAEEERWYASESMDRIMQGTTPAATSEWMRMRAEEKKAGAAPGTHTQISHDDPTTHNFVPARRLAALVIQDLGREVLAVMSPTPGGGGGCGGSSPVTPQQAAAMRKTIESKVRRYLRPPDKKDPWWETLAASDTAANKKDISSRLSETADKTLTEVNQCMISPLKNLEVSRNSLMTIPIGLTITGERFEQLLDKVGIKVPDPGLRRKLFEYTTLQIGVGLMQPFPVEPIPDETAMRVLSSSLYSLFPVSSTYRPARVFGAQFTHRF
jgi:hypothetical protein